MNKVILIIVFVILLTACTANQPEPTFTLLPTDTPIPPTATFTPTPSATNTPTAIALIPLVLAPFEVQMAGIDTHGNMACVKYQGMQTDLDEIIFRATFGQNGHIVERNIEPESINGNNCFEMVDAKYEIAPVQLELNISLSYGSDIKLSEDSKMQTYDLGEYQWEPFLIWPFGESDTGNHVSLPRGGHADAYDFAPETSEQYPNGIGHPVFLPSEGIILTLENGPPGHEHIHNTFSFFPDVGFYYQSGHLMWDIKEGQIYTAGTIIGYLTNETGWAHVHTTLRIPPDWNTMYYESELKELDSFVDMVNPHFQLGGLPLDCGFFICESIPVRIRDAIKAGFFEPHYDWSGGEFLRLP